MGERNKKRGLPSQVKGDRLRAYSRRSSSVQIAPLAFVLYIPWGYSIRSRGLDGMVSSLIPSTNEEHLLCFHPAQPFFLPVGASTALSNHLALRRRCGAHLFTTLDPSGPGHIRSRTAHYPFLLQSGDLSEDLRRCRPCPGATLMREPE